MKSESAAQNAHDALLALKPADVEHEHCALCPEPAHNKEVALVSGDNRTYTEAEHLALMADAVTRETATLTSAKTELETTVTASVAKADVLEAEKAALETAKAEIQKAFDDYKAEVERAREIETAKKDRVAAIKAAHNALPETYFTDQRVQAWAEMDEASFAIVIDGLSALGGTAGEKASKETAAFSGGESPTETKPATTAGLFAARRGKN